MLLPRHMLTRAVGKIMDVAGHVLPISLQRGGEDCGRGGAERIGVAPREEHVRHHWKIAPSSVFRAEGRS